jgi:hypothetical protein
MSALEIGGRGKNAIGATLEDLAREQGRLVFCNGGNSLVVASRENSPDRLVAKYQFSLNFDCARWIEASVTILSVSH